MGKLWKGDLMLIAMEHVINKFGNQPPEYCLKHMTTDWTCLYTFIFKLFNIRIFSCIDSFGTKMFLFEYRIHIITILH